MTEGAPEQDRWLSKSILGLGLASLFSDMNHEMATAILPIFLASALGAPAFTLGLIEGVADGISTIFEIWSGWYSDRIGKRKGLAAVGYLVTAVCVGCLSFTTSWLQVLFARTAGWIGWSIRSPVRDALLLESAAPATVGRVFAFHRMLDTLGAITGPLIAMLLLGHVPIRYIFGIAFLPGLCAVFSLLYLVSERVQARDRRGAWKSVRSLPTPFLRLLLPIGIFGLGNFAPTLLILRTVQILTPSVGMLVAGTFAIGLYTWSNVAYALAGYPLGILSDRCSKRTILGFGYVAFGVICFGFIFASANLFMLIALFALSGLSTAVVEICEPALVSTFMPAVLHGTAYGALSTVQGIGDFLSSILVGALWTYVSSAAGFLFAALLAVVAAVLLIVVGRTPEPCCLTGA